MTAPEVLDLCRERGVRLTATDGKLKFCGPAGSVSPDLKELLARHKGELLGLIGGCPGDRIPETWDTATALALMDAADTAVERFGAHGRDPEIAALADAVVAAHGRRDMAGVRAACRAIEDRAHELAKQQTRTN